MSQASSAEARFVQSLAVETVDGCWIRSVAPTTSGYTQITVGGRRVCAHRFSYEMHVGEIPAGLTLDHLCRNPPCVNPWHLDPVPQGVNTWRGVSPQALVRRTGTCRRGHVVTGCEGRCEECQRIGRMTNEQRRARRREYMRAYMRDYRARA